MVRQRRRAPQPVDRDVKMIAKQERGCDRRAVERVRTRETDKKSPAMDTHAKTVAM